MALYNGAQINNGGMIRFLNGYWNGKKDRQYEFNRIIYCNKIFNDLYFCISLFC